MSTKYLLLSFGLLIWIGCSGGRDPAPSIKKQAQLTLDQHKLARGASLQLKARASGGVQALRLSFKGQLLAEAKDSTLSYSTDSLPLGHQTLKVDVLHSDSLWEAQSIKLQLLASAPPRSYVYLLQARHSHNEDAYTQGLFLHQGILYEGTGRKGKSFLQKRSWPSNEILETIHLSDELFGEGIALKNHRIYQLTWQSHICLIYDVETFEKTEEIPYPTEGWGLTSWKNYLIMSDGSERLHFYSTDPWTYEHSVQVYDHEGAISGINELEAVDDLIYANQYEEDTLLIIDPSNGQLVGKVDCSDLFDEEAYTKRAGKEVDVMNGIAYDSISGHFILTGKLWPYLYEVLIQPQKR